MAKTSQSARAAHFLLCALGALCLTSCSRKQSPADARSIKRAYQLCAETVDARARLSEIAKAYAAEHEALLSDRGAGAQNELVALKSGTLRSTSLPVVLLTIDKPTAFRISITNVGLKEKFALSVRVWNEGDSDSIAKFLSQVDRFWSIEQVEDGVSNHPPCPA